MQHPKYDKWPYNKVLPEHVPIVIERYQTGQSVEKLCLDLPFSKDVALKVLRDFDIPIKTRKENRLSMGFSINENAFLDVKDPECAYFYGWLLTDGNITKREYGYQVSIELNVKDIKVLESLSNYIGNGCSVKTRDRFDKRTENTYYMCSYSFSQSFITERLITLGLEPKKSLRESCPDEFLHNRDFWRGVLEGDGYLSKLSSDTNMQICGSEELCNQWFDYCKSIVPEMHMRVAPQNKNKSEVFYSTYSGRFEECKSVLDSLYLGVPEHLRLERKYNLYVGRFYDGINPN